MKILLANKFFYRKGGAEAIFFNTAELLEKKGHDLIYFSMAHPSNLESSYSKYFVSNVDYFHTGARGALRAALNVLYSFEAKRNIGMLLAEYKPDIAHIHNIYHQISPSILHAFGKFRIPVVMTLHDYKVVCASYLMLNKGKPCEACKRRRYYRCLLEACVGKSKAKSLLNTMEMYLHHKVLNIYDIVDTFIAPSRFVKSKVEEMGFKGRIEYLRHFIDVGGINPYFKRDEDSIIYVGRVSAEKGLVTLIEAMKGLKGIFLKIVGDGPIKEALEKKIDYEGIKNVRFLGYKSGSLLGDEIKKSIAVVLPSECYETFGLTVAEGFVHGKPAIGARIGAIPELIREGESGLLFEPGNAGDLRSKIEFLTGNSARAAEMGMAGRSFAETELSPEKYYNRLIEIYTNAIKRRR